jgi:nitroimidazol reductase NimA-like FMN-containing flavoprotein (pyridoxamine 5'-phosphate oxidase superfamily)
LVKVGTPLAENEIRELLVKEKTGWLATVTSKKEPHLIPIHFGFFDDKVHIVFVYKTTKSLRYIRNNPSVCFGINVGERASEIRCVLIRGKGKVIDNVDLLKNVYLKILTKYSSSKEEAETILQKSTASGTITKRTLVVIKPEKIISWKL